VGCLCGTGSGWPIGVGRGGGNGVGEGALGLVKGENVLGVEYRVPGGCQVCFGGGVGLEAFRGNDELEQAQEAFRQKGPVWV
jgi:hypothetical protein